MKIFALIMFLIFGCNQIFAHTCATFSRLNDKDYNEKLNEVDKIFYGEVISVSETENKIYLVKFKIIRSWKGIESKEISAKLSNPCGISLFVGEKRMIYGYDLKNENIIDVNCCNFSLFDDERMKREYGEGKIVEVAETKSKTEGFFVWFWRKITSVFS